MILGYTKPLDIKERLIVCVVPLKHHLKTADVDKSQPFMAFILHIVKLASTVEGDITELHLANDCFSISRSPWTRLLP